MNRIIYFFVPILGLLAFGGYYFGVYHKQLMEKQAEEKRIQDEENRRKAAEKAEEERRALAEAEERTRQKREEEEAKRLADEAKQKAEDDKLIAAVNEAETRVADLTSQHEKLEVTLLNTRRQREAEEKAAFDLSRQVELARIDRRNAELKIQLAMEKIATRVEASSLVQDIFPAPVTAPAAKAN